MRRLYDAQHRLIAAEWMQHNGEHGQYSLSNDAQPTKNDRELLADDLWKQDVSPSTFRELNGDHARVRPIDDGYELTTEPGETHPQILSATLVLDRHFHSVREFMRVRRGSDIREVRFVQADYERRPTSSVPDAVFDPRDQGVPSKAERHLSSSGSFANDVQLAELHIAVLFQLSQLHADTGELIEVKQTPHGRIRVTGTVADEGRKQEILSRLKVLANHQFLEIDVVSSSDLRQQRGRKASKSVVNAINTYELGETKAPADDLLRKYFQAQGLSGVSLDSAIAGFSREVLGHAQRALQNASALSRLGSTFSTTELRSIDFSAKQQWTEMVEQHAAALEVELQALREQLARLSPSAQMEFPHTVNDRSITGSPAEFAYIVSQLLHSTQNLNRNIGNIFAANQAAGTQPEDIHSLLDETIHAIPLQEAVEISSFAVQLNASGRAAAIDRQHSRPQEKAPNRP